MIINEIKRSQLINKSKSKDKLNRFANRLTVGDVSISRVGILELAYLKQPDLDIYFEANGYRVSLRLVRFMDNLRSVYRNQYDKVSAEGGTSSSKRFRRLVEIALKDSLNSKDIRVECECADFRYRFAYVATMNDYQFQTKETRPALKTNPNNSGGACKHILRVLTKPSIWTPKVVTGVLNVIRRNPRILDE